MARARPNERRRAGSKSAPGSPPHIDELEEEHARIGDDSELSLGHNGDKRDDTEELRWRQVEEFRNKGGQRQSLGADTGGPEPTGSKGASAQQVTAELQKAAQANPQRSVFGVQRKAAQPPQVSPPALAPPRPPPPEGPAPVASRALTGARGLLATGRPQGSYVRERAAGGTEGATSPPRALAAVEEARRLLVQVEGIERVSLGENKAGKQVVLVVARRGVSLQSLRAVPQKVQDLDTVVLIPFDALPLRRPAGETGSTPSLPARRPPLPGKE